MNTCRIRATQIRNNGIAVECWWAADILVYRLWAIIYRWCSNGVACNANEFIPVYCLHTCVMLSKQTNLCQWNDARTNSFVCAAAAAIVYWRIFFFSFLLLIRSNWKIWIQPLKRLINWKSNWRLVRCEYELIYLSVCLIHSCCFIVHRKLNQRFAFF